MEKTLVLLKPCTLQRENDAIDRCDIERTLCSFAREVILSDFKGFHDVDSRDCMLLRRY